jgi:hypothetical protein
MTRSLCLGWCPAYSVAVFDDGRLTYEGEHNVKTIGKAEGRVDRTTIESIQREAQRAGLTALAADCCNCTDVTDSPSVSISYDFGAGKRGAVQHYHGCWKAPGWLGKFENRIDELLATEQFIGTAAERERRFGSGR